MPLGDGTGPVGLGPRTGRGRGWCRRGQGRALAAGVFLPMAAAVVRDLLLPDGRIRTAIRMFVAQKRHARPRRDKEISAHHEIIGEQPVQTQKRGNATT
ncbi:MAG: hypothetical protein GF331_10575 [Chitinivibrionales bacterium]|nr:hypothetical protein [Chitinivibrionales bacterium]